ncbi:CAP domain-containing protein [Mycena amicta]|nr:CAP domain-containing protein [Mycena amicta]
MARLSVILTLFVFLTSANANANALPPTRTDPRRDTTSEDYNGSVASNTDVERYLTEHNTLRAEHGAKPLVWDIASANAAQRWANHCEFQHSQGQVGSYGENLAIGSRPYTIEEATTAWASERYHYGQPSHFTQMVWKNTTRVGCAVAFCPNIYSEYGGADYYVCEYYPAGNVIGQFGQNVS